ncbi:MAG: lipocalin-like domain-containing protein [Betaproteobacteria bacterium]|nr:lipocalin-like domain-containing protein [Betaproteobacteria bacterium]
MCFRFARRKARAYRFTLAPFQYRGAKVKEIKKILSGMMMLAAVSPGAFAEPGPLEQALIGTWRIADYVAVREDGDEVRPMGKDLAGYIMYAADGHLSVNLMKPGRPKYASGDIMQSTTEERAAAAEGYFAYAGTFKVDEANRIVIHLVLYSLMPNWVDTEQRRMIFLDGDKLELRSPGPVIVAGDKRVLRILWERAKR